MYILLYTIHLMNLSDALDAEYGKNPMEQLQNV